MERNNFSTFSRGSSKEHSCEIILKSAHWPYHFIGFSFFSSDGHFVQRSGTIYAILVDVILWVFLFLALAESLFSGAEQF